MQSARAGLFHREENEPSWNLLSGSLKTRQGDLNSMTAVVDQHEGQLAFIVEREKDAPSYSLEERKAFAILAHQAGMLVENHHLHEEGSAVRQAG